MSTAIWSWEGWDPLELRAGRRHVDPCDECGLPHTPERRQAVLRRMLPATVRQIADAWPHLWPDDSPQSNGHSIARQVSKTLRRDLHAIGAVPRRENGPEAVWYPGDTK